ncbi:MAG TPA: terminase small subunit [Reyranella sp.]|jgi:phage terminase Nu1 subunit (DNA packaging protein)|nr:terminase small subunit [Reyranella sp.]
MLVNKAELARVFGVSAPTVDRWIVDGCPIVKGGSNGVAYEFDTDQVKDWKDRREADDKRQAEEREQEIRRIQSEMFAADEPLGPAGMSQAEIRTYLENQQRVEVLKRQRGERLDRADVLNDYQAVFNVVRQHTLGWSTTVGRLLSLDAAQQALVERLVRELLGDMMRQIKDPALRPVLRDAA